MATRGSYVHISMGEFRGHPDIVNNFLRKLMVSNKKIHRALRTAIPIREIFNFHHLPKLYFGFNAEFYRVV